MENKIKVIHDQHVHTSFSEDSNEDMEEYIKIAINNKCSYFIMTDHLDINIFNTGYDWIADYKKEREIIDSIQDKYKNIKILQGIETGYKANEKDRIKTREIAFLLPFDVINFSIHDYNDLDFYKYESLKEYGIDKAMECYFNSMLKGVKEEDFDVLCHIDYGFKTLYLNDNSLVFSKYEDRIKEILKELIKRKKTLEINTKVQRIFKDNTHTLYLLNLYKSLGGVDLTLSSDAHNKEYYMFEKDKYIKIIKEAGFDHLCYFVNRKKHYYYI